MSLQNIGVSRTKGRRTYNEDQYGIEQLIIGSITPDATNPPQSFLYLAVFDGHGGPACSKFCAQTFPRHVSICQFCIRNFNLEIQDSSNKPMCFMEDMECLK